MENHKMTTPHRLTIYSLLLLLIGSSCTTNKTADTEKDNTLISNIDTHLKTNFAQPGYTASWYSNILLTRISHQPQGNIIEVVTILDKTEKQAAINICGAISGYWQQHKNKIDGLRIIGNGQKIVGYRYSLGSGCS